MNHARRPRDIAEHHEGLATGTAGNSTPFTLVELRQSKAKGREGDLASTLREDQETSTEPIEDRVDDPLGCPANDEERRHDDRVDEVIR